MSISQLRNCNFGLTKANATGSNGVGYTLYNYDGTVYQTRTTASVYQVAPNSGIYASYIDFPTDWRGQVLWDTGTVFVTASFATEQYNVEENNPKVNDNWSMLNSITGSIQLIRDVTVGRWKVVGNQMLFYKEDNATLIATFNLFDDMGIPTMDSVFERVKV